MRRRISSIAFCLAGVSPLAAVAFSMPSHAQEAVTTKSYDIPAQPLGQALSVYAEQSGIEIIFTPDAVRGKRSNALRGRHAPAEALSLLLRGTGLSSRRGSGTTIIVEALRPEGPGGSAAVDIDKDVPVKTAEPIVVTGTRIRGGTTPSPVIQITEEDIRNQGYSELGDVIRSIPQNFSGGQNPGVMLGSGLNNQNITGGSALNLRGLGVDATLTLLNGRRLSYGGYAQGVDLSVIPVAAVSRIEILADGASALYGSDAVAGVSNVILKRDFTGVTTASRYGFATDGGREEIQLSLTGGSIWRSGGFIAAYDYRDIDAMFADQRSYTAYMDDPNFLYPSQRHHSGIGSFHQEIAPFATFRIDGLYTDRTTRLITTFPTTREINLYRSDIFTLAPEFQFTLAGDWSVNIGGSYSGDETRFAKSRFTLDGAPGNVDKTCYCNSSYMVDTNAEGPLFRLPAGEVRMAVGAGYRKNNFTIESTIPLANFRGNLSSRYAFGELSLPLVSPEQGVRRVHRLTVTGALRHEDYRQVGQITTPKIGAIYGPTADLTLKGSWGRSFKAPTLMQRFQTVSAVLHPGSDFDLPPDSTLLYVGGSNPDLEPERAKTWSATLSLHPRAMPRLLLDLSYFEIDYTDRVVTPVSSLASVLHQPALAPLVTRNPTVQQVNNAVALAGEITNITSGPFDSSQVAAIVDGRYVNAARESVKGVDMSGSYSFNFADGQASVRGSASWLKGRRQFISGQPEIQSVGTIFHPASFRAQGGVIWTGSGLTLSSFINYVDGVINDREPSPVKTDSFTTLETTARYRTKSGRSLLSDVEFNVSVHNLLDQTPPLFKQLAAYLVNYDSTNYSAIGRTITIGISKHW